VLWIARVGAPWRDLPDPFGNRNSAFKRFRRWAQKGVFEELFCALHRAIRADRPCCPRVSHSQTPTKVPSRFGYPTTDVLGLLPEQERRQFSCGMQIEAPEKLLEHFSHVRRVTKFTFDFRQTLGQHSGRWIWVPNDQ
jgi:hypothetical protein